MTDVLAGITQELADRYRIERHLGEGGMATVYLAHDLKHDRDVAIKVLRPELTAILGGERFLNEIKVTANLQHPNILPLYDSGEAGSFLYYVMAYVEGETLREKLSREKQLALDEAVKIGQAIAGALEYAHQHGVIHRDIKPENILLQSGQALVADFGIALAVSAAGGTRLTETGLSLGTPQYMSPEQATGDRQIDARSDVYSLGAVVYEMLTGDPPHTGSTVQAIVAKVLTESPLPVTRTRETVPPNVDAAIRRALAKTPADRFTSAAHFAEALANPAFSLPTPTDARGAPASAPGPWNRLSVIMTGVAALLLLTTLLGWLRSQPAEPVSRYSVQLPEEQALQTRRGSRLAISPDGSRLAYVGPGEGGGQLWIRPRDQLRATPLPGTAGAAHPFFSPDGSRVGYLSLPGAQRVMVASLGGGPPVSLVDSGVGADGATWGPDGYLYYDGITAGGTTGIMRVPERGGLPQPVTIVDTSRGETDHIWPEALPGGKSLLFTIMHGTRVDEADIAVLDLASGTTRVLVRGIAAEYSTSGHLLYVTADGTLMAAPFDRKRLELGGEGWAVANGLAVRAFGSVDLALSATGTLLYLTGTRLTEPTELVWMDRSGQAEPVDPGWVGDFRSLALSPDGRQIAVSIEQEQAFDEHVWVKRLPRGSLTKLTFEGSENFQPAWTPDGRSVTFASNRNRNRDLYVKRADGSAVAELLVDRDVDVREGRWSNDGEWLVFWAGTTQSGSILARGKGPDAEPMPLVTDGFSPRLSPDGRWLAYVSDETQSFEVYVRPFPNAGTAKWQVSTNGGLFPVWASSGRELFFRSLANELVAVEILPGATFAMGERRVLFSLTGYANGFGAYDVTPDGQRFLLIRYRDGGQGDELIVVENMFEELRRQGQ